MADNENLPSASVSVLRPRSTMRTLALATGVVAASRTVPPMRKKGASRSAPSGMLFSSMPLVMTLGYCAVSKTFSDTVIDTRSDA